MERDCPRRIPPSSGRIPSQSLVRRARPGLGGTRASSVPRLLQPEPPASRERSTTLPRTPDNDGMRDNPRVPRLPSRTIGSRPN